MTKEVKIRKTKEQKRQEAKTRESIKRSPQKQLEFLNLKKHRAIKERKKLASKLGISFEDTFSTVYYGHNGFMEQVV